MAVQKVALVTGSGKHRIGWQVAQELAQRGYALVIHYLTSQADALQTVRELENAGTNALALQADLAREREVHQMMDSALTRFGRLDVLVNCAAAWTSRRLEDVTADDVRAAWEINTLGTFVCSQRAGLAMVQQPEGGCIVTIGDWATHHPYLHHAAYFVAKGAIETLTRTLAVEFAERNPRVRVNCILPGPVMFPADLPEAERREAIAGTLVKREGTPADVTQAVLFLIENTFVTGISLPVDGGRGITAGLKSRPGDSAAPEG